MRHSSFSLVSFALLAGCAGVDEPAAPRATGEIGPWKAAPSMPTARANHCTAVIDNRVFVIGGNHAVPGGAFEKTAEIHSAQLVGDQLGPWQLAGQTASPVTECAAATDAHRLYVVDGLYDRDSDGGQVWYADMIDGGLTELLGNGPLPDDKRAISTEAAVRHGELLVMDTLLPAEGDTTLTLRMTTSVSSWLSPLDWQIGFRAQAQYAFTDRFIYTLGGYQDPAVGTTTDVFVAPVDGASPVRATTPLPAAVGFGEAIAVDDWLFVVGGRSHVFNAPGTADVFAAPIAGDGSLGEWRTLASLPVARTNHELALVGDYLVLTGGAAMGPGDATVLLAQVRWSGGESPGR